MDAPTAEPALDRLLRHVVEVKVPQEVRLFGRGAEGSSPLTSGPT